jgi:hypothetical protein
MRLFWIGKGIKIIARSVRPLLVAASVFLSSPILVTLKKDVLGSSETRFLQEPHGVTSQKTPLFIWQIVFLCTFTEFQH